MKRLILGGTFNPIHMGHLMMSEYIREELGFEDVLFMPTGNPPHKTHGVLDAEERLDMVRLATEDNPHFSVSDIEVRREGLTYSVDSIRILEDLFPQDEFHFLIGSDILLDLKDWRKISELAASIPFVLAVRPGFDAMTRERMTEEITLLKERHNLRITVVPTPRYEISSTDLRARLRESRSVRYLIPDIVAKYIEAHGLYREIHPWT